MDRIQFVGYAFQIEMKYKAYLQKFKILNISNKNAGKVEKVRFGRPYPVLKPKCTVLFNSGETATGVVNTRSVFLRIIDPDTGFTRRSQESQATCWTMS